MNTQKNYYMNTIKNILYCSTLLLLVACTTPTNISYFQDAKDISGMAVKAQKRFTLRPEDKINVIVNSPDLMVETLFTLTTTGQHNILGTTNDPQTQAGKSTGSYGQPIAYTVDEQGDILFPILGKVSVIGKTRMEVAETITKRLVERDLVKDPLVTVEYVNMGISVLGEVNKPGRFD